jgi:DNA-binding winged helix-turn-helix (wHTH) protein
MAAGVLRFGPFELNARSGELFKDGRRLPLSPQPVRLLSLLASRAGELVTRDEIRRHLWPDDVFVDFDLGLNSCLAHVRTVLGDRARSPRYIETLPAAGTGSLRPSNDRARSRNPRSRCCPSQILQPTRRSSTSIPRS